MAVSDQSPARSLIRRILHLHFSDKLETCRECSPIEPGVIEVLLHKYITANAHRNRNLSRLKGQRDGLTVVIILLMEVIVLNYGSTLL